MTVQIISTGFFSLCDKPCGIIKVNGKTSDFIHSEIFPFTLIMQDALPIIMRALS